MLANIALLADIHLAMRYGAEGVGLLRSEFSFLTYEDFPDENQQLALYNQMLEAVGEAAGHDPHARYRSRQVSALHAGSARGESVPRMAFDPDLARNVGPVQSSVARDPARRRALQRPDPVPDDLRASKSCAAPSELLAESQAELYKEGLEHNPNIEVGIMVEVPSAVWLAPRLAREVDFFSIGTNDLIQYLLAADRNNPKVAHLYEALHPAVISAIAEVVNVARAADKEVCICGEMASDPLATLLLVGIGLDELSLRPLFIPVVRKLVREVDFQTTRLIARECLQMASVQEIKGYLVERYRDLGLINLVEMYR